MAKMGLDLAGMAATAVTALADVEVLDLYVTGLTVVLVTVINQAIMIFSFFKRGNKKDRDDIQALHNML
jgi:hypothetical protein